MHLPRSLLATSLKATQVSFSFAVMLLSNSLFFMSFLISFTLPADKPGKFLSRYLEQSRSVGIALMNYDGQASREENERRHFLWQLLIYKHSIFQENVTC